MTTIIRAHRDEHYTVITNSTARDTEISYRALGVLTHILSHTDGWRITASDLAKGAGREGRDAIRSALTALERAGYLKRVKQQDAEGRWTTSLVVYDTPRDRAKAPSGAKAGTPLPAVAEQNTPASGAPADAVMEAWKTASAGKTAQSAHTVRRCVQAALDNGVDADAVRRAVVAIAEEGEPVVEWRLTRHINRKAASAGASVASGKAIHYAADKPHKRYREEW